MCVYVFVMCCVCVCCVLCVCICMCVCIYMYVCVCVCLGNLTKVKEALERSKKLPYVRDKDGATPLMFAANKGHIEVRKKLTCLFNLERVSTSVV